MSSVLMGWICLTIVIQESPLLIVSSIANCWCANGVCVHTQASKNALLALLAKVNQALQLQSAATSISDDGLSLYNTQDQNGSVALQARLYCLHAQRC